MPLPLIAAGIAAAGAVGGGVIAAGASKKAARTAQDTATQQIAASNANRDYQYNLNAPAIASGAGADSRIQALLGLGGDAAAANDAFAGYRGSTGYDFRTQQGMGAINSNAYARGMGNSGATLKALTNYGQNAASAEFGNYLGQLGGVSASGASARGLVAGVGGAAANQQINALGDAGQAKAQSQLANGQIWSGVLQNLAGIGGAALGGGRSLGSSYYNPILNNAPRPIVTAPQFMNPRYG